MSDIRRLNVAVTRAKAKLILVRNFNSMLLFDNTKVGCRHVLRTDPNLDQIIGYIEKEVGGSAASALC